MGMSENISSLKLEVKVIEARNIELKSLQTNLFVRFYLGKIELNTKEIGSRSHKDVKIWNQSFKLECHGDKTAIEELKQQRVVFELRRRKMKKWSRSELVGRGEISWRSVMESEGMDIERFVVLREVKGRVLEDCDEKPVLLKIGLKVEGLKMVKNKKVEDVCECGDCRGSYCLDYDAFVVACALS